VDVEETPGLQSSRSCIRAIMPDIERPRVTPQVSWQVVDLAAAVDLAPSGTSYEI
jgi:hypothetical protein